MAKFAKEIVNLYRSRQVNENLLHRRSESLCSAEDVMKHEELRQLTVDRLVPLYNLLFKLQEPLDTNGVEHFTELQCGELEKVITEIEEYLAKFDDPHNHAAGDPISTSMNFDLWEKKQTIGSGGYGTVYVAINRHTGELCAIKEMLCSDSPQHAQALHKEIQVLSRLEHESIVKYHGSKIEENQISLFMEYVQPGSMRRYISSQGALQEPLVQHFTAQILSGLTYLHSERVVHSLLTLVWLYVAQSAGNHSVLGTICYAAPEVICQDPYNSSNEACAADIWSLGCAVIHMFTGARPWSNCEHEVQVIYHVCYHKRNPAIPDNLSLAGKLFLISCFMRDPAWRPSAATLLSHPFVKTQFDDLQNHEATDPIYSAMDFNQWEKKQLIESSRNGIVHVGFNRKTGQFCAVKEILGISDLQDAKSFHQEIRVLSRLEHQNIVKYYASKRVGSQIFIYMEYVQSGSLREYIRKRGALQESLVRNFTAQVLSGLAYLHSLKIVHGDINADHLLVDSENIVKLLVAFGLTTEVAQSAGKHSVLGTICYAAPEVICRNPYNSSNEACAADIWSLGCAVIHMFTGARPWSNFEAAQVMCQVFYGKGYPEIADNLSRAGKHFLKSCFMRDPARRPSAATLLSHPFVKTQFTES